MTAPPSLFAAILSIGNGVGGEEVAKEKKMRRENSFLSLWVPPLALSSYLGSHAGPLNGVFLNPQNPNLDPSPSSSLLSQPCLLESFPSHKYHQSLELGNRERQNGLTGSDSGFRTERISGVPSWMIIPHQNIISIVLSSRSNTHKVVFFF